MMNHATEAMSIFAGQAWATVEKKAVGQMVV